MHYLKKGFTLIELLVVISIIALLASIVFASLNSARVKARDARRIADLNQIRTALALYFDTNNQYPPPCSSSWCFSTSGGNWITGLAPAYISTVALDPTNNAANNQATGNYSYTFYSFTNAGDYDLLAQFEDISNPNRCAVKCWRWHVANGPDRTAMCNGAGTCVGVVAGSPYLYADH